MLVREHKKKLSDREACVLKLQAHDQLTPPRQARDISDKKLPSPKGFFLLPQILSGEKLDPEGPLVLLEVVDLELPRIHKAIYLLRTIFL